MLATSRSLAPVAYAGAWSVPAGEQQWYATVSRETSDFGPAWRADDFADVGIGDGWQVVTKLESQISTGGTYNDRSGFRLGVQKAFAIDDRTSFSLLASCLGGESLDGAECAGSGYEVRAEIGTSFSVGGRNGFVNVEAGHRARDDCERNVFEVATGIEFAPSWNLGLKAWQDGGSAGSTKAELNLGYDLGFMAVGIGWGQEVFRELRGKRLGRFGPDPLLARSGDFRGLASAQAFGRLTPVSVRLRSRSDRQKVGICRSRNPSRSSRRRTS